MSETSTAPVPVNWEAVRALAMVVGVREAARRMGISEETTKKRCLREGWLATAEAKRVNQMAIAQRSGITVSPQMSPGSLIQAELTSLGAKSRVSLARGVAKAAEHVETLSGSDILAESGNVKAIAQTADLVHGWKDASPQVKIRLDVLGATAEAQIVDVEADVTPSDVWDSVSTDVDDY